MLTLEHTVIEHRLMRHGNGMQACGHSKYHMEVLLRDNLLPSESDPLLPFLVLAFGAMTVTAAVVADLALEYEHHLALKADVLPSELADLADSKRTVIYESKQCLVIQGAVAQEPCDLFLGEYPWKLLWLAYLGQYKSARLLEPHNLVVSLQSEDRMLEEREAVALLVQDSREIVVDVCLCELFRQLFEKQHRLCNLQVSVQF